MGDEDSIVEAGADEGSDLLEAGGTEEFVGVDPRKPQDPVRHGAVGADEGVKLATARHLDDPDLDHAPVRGARAGGFDVDDGVPLHARIVARGPRLRQRDEVV